MRYSIESDIDPGVTEAYETCREYVAARVHQQGRPQKTIAADMDYSPSQLSRKLSQNPNDTNKFTLDDLESFINVTGDKTPLLFLVQKYLKNEAPIGASSFFQPDEKIRSAK